MPALRDQGAQRASRGKGSHRGKHSQSAQLFNENLVLVGRGWKVCPREVAERGGWWHEPISHGYPLARLFWDQKNKGFSPCSFQDRHSDHGGTGFLSPKRLASEEESAVGNFIMKSCWRGQLANGSCTSLLPKAASLASSRSCPLAAAGSTSGLQWLCPGGHREKQCWWLILHGAISSCEEGLPDLLGSGAMVAAAALLPCLALCSTSLLLQRGQGFISSWAVSCALSVGSASGPAAAQTAVNHCVWLQYKVPLEVFWWVFSCLFFA